MITPREARLVRVATLQMFREAVMTLACAGPASAVRDRIVVVPTRAAAAHLLRAIEDSHIAAGQAIVLPEFVTRAELVRTLADRLPPANGPLTDAEREVLLAVAARSAAGTGFDPPFKLRPGLIAEMLRFYDELRWYRNSIDEFERRALDRFEPGAEHDRGAARLVRQTTFLAATYREFERRSVDAGTDEHALRERLMNEPAARPWRHVVVTVADRAFEPAGLYAGDWDLLTRVPGLHNLDVVITDTVLAGALHERMHSILPGVVEERYGDGDVPARPSLLIPVKRAEDVSRSTIVVHHTRDREEEVALFARRVKNEARSTGTVLDRVALVVHQPLPYVYVARDVLRSAGIPCQMFDALPLAAEPFSAAVDLVFSAISSNFARGPAIALLRSPHFRFGESVVLSAPDIASLDRALAEAGYLGEVEVLERLADAWRDKAPERGLYARALRAVAVLAGVARRLTPVRQPAPVARHLQTLLTFVLEHEQLPGDGDSYRARHLRARGAVLGTLIALEQAYARFDATPVEFDHVAALVRRWIDGQTFQPRAGDVGVHLVDAASARYGAFEEVQLAGLVDGEWPDRPRRNIFYTPSVLRDLGWPAEADRLEGVRSAFLDLLQLPSQRLALSTFSLESDVIVSPSLLLEEVERVGLTMVEWRSPTTRIFDYEAMIEAPASVDHEGPAPGLAPPDQPMPAYSLSALERYQDCPFKFFAADVLRLEEAPEDESALSPRARGRFIHEVFQRFFESWDARGLGTITSDRLDDARALFSETAEPLLAKLPEADAALERTRLFGSAISLGIVDVVLGVEASRPVHVRERLLEYRLEGEFAVGSADGRRVALKGVADRIDLLEGRRLRVIDYKSGYAPNPRRALQVPIYSLCAQERLAERDDAAWQVDEAAYVAFSGKRTLVPVVRTGGDASGPLGDARSRLFAALDGIADGIFPPRPHDPMICRYCAYASVCRKDYVGDE